MQYKPPPSSSSSSLPLPLSPSPPLARSPTCFCYLLLHCGSSSSPPGHTLSLSIVSSPPAEKSSLSLNQNHCLWVLSNLRLCFSLLPATKTLLLFETVSCLRDSASPCKSLLFTQNRVRLRLSYLIFFSLLHFLLFYLTATFLLESSSMITIDHRTSRKHTQKTRSQDK